MDYEASPERTNLEINVVHLSSDYFVVPEEDLAHLQFGPHEAVFQKPSEKDYIVFERSWSWCREKYLAFGF